MKDTRKCTSGNTGSADVPYTTRGTRTTGLAGIWWAMAIDESFRAVLFIIRFARGKWIKKNMVTA